MIFIFIECNAVTLVIQAYLNGLKGRHQNFGEIPYLYIVKVDGGRG